MYETLQQPWHWGFSGFMIAGILFFTTWLGRYFGISSSFQAICSWMGGGKWFDYFRIDLKEHQWRFVFIAGAILGGFIARFFLMNDEPLQLSASTLQYLTDVGISTPQESSQLFVPAELFSLSNPWSWAVGIAGGLLVGFGTRYAGGCTSGHAITGLSHLSWPSFVSVIGFFIGGLLMTHLILPSIFTLFTR